MVKPRHLGAMMALVPISIVLLLFVPPSLASITKNHVGAHLSSFRRSVDKGSPTPQEQKTLEKMDKYFQGRLFQGHFKLFKDAKKALEDIKPETKMVTDVAALTTPEAFSKMVDFIWKEDFARSEIQLGREKLQLFLPHQKYLAKTGPNLQGMIQDCEESEEALRKFLVRWVPVVREKLLLSGVGAGLLHELWHRLPLTFEKTKGGSAGAGKSPKADGSVRPAQLAKLFPLHS